MKTSLFYTVNSRPVGATKGSSVSRKRKQKPWMKSIARKTGK